MNMWTDMIRFAQEASDIKKQFFFEHVLGSYQWWLLLGLAIVPWILWFILVDKQRLRSIVLTGFFSALITITFDGIGGSLAMWAYPYQLVYFSPWLLPVDLCAVPVSIMIFYQYCRTWKSYLVVVILLALFTAFIGEPLFDRMHIAVVIHWKYIYSPFGYFIIAVISRWLADWMMRPKWSEK